MLLVGFCMRRSFTPVYLALLALFLGVIGVSSVTDMATLTSPSRTKTHRVAILPICNPGTACDPDLPDSISYTFFKHPAGIARYLKQTSHGQVIIKGKALPWIRAKQKIKSYHDVINNLPGFLSSAGAQIKLSDYDIFFIYINTPGQPRDIGWPPGQIIMVNETELSPGLGLMINSPVYRAIDHHNRDTAILPSVSWAAVLLRILEIHNQLGQICL